jgi:hypothetical protein
LSDEHQQSLANRKSVVEEENGQSPKPLAERIENTISGFITFLADYARTIFLVASPRKLAELLSAEPSNQTAGLVRPLTFLCVSFIPYGVMLDASATSVWDVLITPEEAAAKIAERLSDISPTKILVGALPALLAIFLGSWLSANMLPPPQGKRFRDALYYLFGLQFFGVFVLFLVLVLGHERFAGQLLPVFILNVILWPFAHFYLFYVFLLVVIGYPVVMGSVLMMTAQPKGWRRVWAPAAAAVSAFAITLAVTWVGSRPAVFKQALSPPAEPTITYLDSKVELHTRSQPPLLRASIAIHNSTKGTIAIKRDGWRLNAKVSQSAKPFPINAFSMRLSSWSDSQAPFLVIASGEFKWMSGVADLDSRDVADFRAAENGLIFITSTVDGLEGSRVSGSWVQLRFITDEQ